MVDIIIVNWNSGIQLKACIDSIIKFGGSDVTNTIVVDNGSIDGSEKLVENVQNVTLILANQNLGFGKACNLGVESSHSEYLLFLNPDAELLAGTLSGVINFIEDPTNKDIGICGVQLIDGAGKITRSCARFPSTSAFVVHSIGLDWIIRPVGSFMAEWDHLNNRKVDHVIGAFFFIRRELFIQLDGFDERFFLYFEDLDFSYRAHQIGWNSFYLAEAQALHVGGGTSNQIKARRLFYSLRSRILYAFKHFSTISALIVLFTTLFIEPLSRSVLALGRNSWQNIKETWIGYFMLWSWLASLQNKNQHGNRPSRKYKAK
jgi:GT2 family glycosyltransferase